MYTVTNLNKTSIEQLEILLLANRIRLKNKARDHYVLYCPSCEKPEAFIYFQGNTRNIECNRKTNCGFKEELWGYIADNQGINSSDTHLMLKYINDTLGHKVLGASSPRDLIKTQMPDLPELVERSQFFKDCQEVFVKALNSQNDEGIVFAWKYLSNDRGYNIEQITAFKLGFFPNRKELFDTLQDRGYTLDKLQHLITKYFDTVLKINDYPLQEEGKNRITFPWYDTQGDIVGFTIRKPTIDEKLKPKYLNNNGLSKTNYLFNLPYSSLGNTKRLVVVEGLLDALIATYINDKAGERYHFVATGNNYISDKQIEFLKAQGYLEIILLPDNDKAGEGFINSAKKLIAHGIKPSVASLPEGFKDIDELLRKYPDSTDITSILMNPKPINLGQSNNIDQLIATLKAEIKQDQATGNTLEADKYRRRVQEIQKLVLQSDIAINKDNEHLRVLNNILLNIGQYNDLLAKDNEEDQPYTYSKFFSDLHEADEGLKTGFRVLDQWITIQPSTLAFVAGRPGHGKTTMMLNLLRNMLRAYPNKSFLFYSYEEKKSDILLKLMLSMIKPIDLITKEGISPLTELLKQLKHELTEGLSKPLREVQYEVQSWLREGRLRIMTPKLDVESLSPAILEQVISCTIRSEAQRLTVKPVGAIFIDYVQKLTTAEQKISRQQEIQKVCHKLLSTALNKEVKAAIILGAQVNREVKSLDSFNADNMREAGDIEQDANLILGVWDNKAARLSMLQEVLETLEKKLVEAEIEGDDKKITKTISQKENLINKIKEQSLYDSATEVKQIKVLKNRNGKTNKVIDLSSYPDQFLFTDFD